MAKLLAVLGLALALCIASAGAFSGRVLLQTSEEAAAPGEAGKLFDYGRPCTLVGDTAESQITGPENTVCKNCGSGATATPDPTCTFKPIECPVGSSISIFYHSSVHHLFAGATPCDFGPTATEACPNATADAVSAETPCVWPCATVGNYFLSDRAGKGGVGDGEYCRDFGASLPVNVTAAA